VSQRRPALLTAALLVTGALTVNLAFAGLGAVFDYPDVLAKQPGLVLAEFRAHQGAVVAWFTLLALGAALLAPIAVRLARLGGGAAMRASVPVGIAAAAVQVVGLSRWPLVVPGLAAQATDPAAAADAAATFETLSLILGTIVGETLGYALTAAWTVLVVVGLYPALGRVLAGVGLASSVLIVAGVVIPLGVPGADAANFAGYVLWSLWLVALAWWVARPVAAPGAVPPPATG